MNTLINEIRKDLKNQANDEVREKSRRFFKEEIKCYGIRNPQVHSLAKDYYKKMKSPSKEEVFEICELLWQSGYVEEAIMACDFSFYVKRHYELSDFGIFESWIALYVNNWAACDTFCNHTVGTLIEKYPELTSRLKHWGRSENRWMRRAAAVSLIVPARKGKFLNDIFEIAVLLLTDSDDMVQKGYGWMLKEASKKHQQAVFDFVLDNKAVMPRTALRYAIEKMPNELIAIAMKK